MNIRERNQSYEDLTLINQAKFSKDTLGRKCHELEDDIRTVFMVDRDRIIHSKSFRRLKHKTQVFIQTSSDHYRTRLTHTIEVSQIARTIAVGIGLNEYLCEAIAMGHDLGHVAFAHVGEAVINDFLPGGFKHSEQSVRVVSKLEKGGKGLNLTAEVIDGILKHSGLNDTNNIPITLEGQVVRYSDKIAYVNHDIDDSIRAGLLTEEQIPKHLIDELGNSNSERINTLVHDIVNNTVKNIERGNNKVSLSDKKTQALLELRSFMFKNIYLGNVLKDERKKAGFIVENMLQYYFGNPEKMPVMYRNIADEEGKERAVADYIAGMSDDYCLSTFNRIYIPKTIVY